MEAVFTLAVGAKVHVVKRGSRMQCGPKLLALSVDSRGPERTGGAA